MTSEPDDPDLLAAEYVLGTLDGADRVAFETRLGWDEAAQSALARWSDRLADLMYGLDPTGVPPALWASIQARIDATDAAPDASAPPPNVSFLARLRQRISLPALTVAGLGVAAAVASVVWMLPALRVERVVPQAVQPVRPPAYASLEIISEDKTLTYVLNVAADRQSITARPARVQLAADRAHELWVIPADGTPRSLGLLDARADAQLTIDAPTAAFLTPGATLAISLEPTGGSPTGLPTGPVLATRALS